MALLAPPDHADDYLDLLILSQDAIALRELRSKLSLVDDKLAEHFYQWQNISRLVRTRAWVIEQFVLYFWNQQLAQCDNLALVAVGGFGRGDLQPHSDVDLLVLYQGHLPAEPIGQFIQNLWDLGLDVGHAVRTVDQSVSLASNDVTVATNIMEGRFMRGDKLLFEALSRCCSDERIWSGRDFFQAKYKEQLQRHRKYGDTAYNLEPNIKEGQGGLRDIQMVTWVAQRHFHVGSMHGLVDVGFLQPDEYISLQKGQRKLWKIRYALHLLAGRKEDRLLFEYQKKLAKIFGYEDDANGLAVEKFMQAHYRNVMQLELLNMRLLQLFKENILQSHDDKKIIELDGDFLIINHYLEARSAKLFIDNPEAIIDLFVHYQQRPGIAGIRANTLRYLSQSLYVIDDDFRASKTIKKKFLSIFKNKNLVYCQLNLMNALGILGLYIPVFGKIVGRMQYDLFHMYTVDQHSLFVLRNIRRIIRGKNPHVLAHQICQKFDEPYLLCLAGFFHDVAKGRGGDHAELGAIDAAEFASSFYLPEQDGKLLSWLVKYHLIMSVVAQKQDISDLQVIEKFANLVENQKQLDALYVLTIADISGTDPKLWNTYKDSLLSELYRRTSRYLAQTDLIDPVKQTQKEALKLLTEFDQQTIKNMWGDFSARFFKENDARRVAQITRIISENNGQNTFSVIEQHADGFEFFIFGEEHQGLFHHVTLLLTAYPVSIVNARILSSDNQKVMDSFHCLGPYDNDLLKHLENDLLKMMETKKVCFGYSQKWPSKRVQNFDMVTEIHCESSRDGSKSRIEIRCADRPGLLATITGCFLDNEIYVEGAKVATFGHQAEDVFWISIDGSALPDKTADQLLNHLRQLLAFK